MSFFDCLGDDPGSLGSVDPVLEDLMIGSSSLLEETVEVSTTWQENQEEKDLLGQIVDGTLNNDQNEEQQPRTEFKFEKTWEHDTDTFLDSMLTDPQVHEFTETLGSGISDTSSDSGLDQVLLSPIPEEAPVVVQPPRKPRIEFIRIASNGKDKNEKQIKVLSPMTNSPLPRKVTKIRSPQIGTVTSSARPTITLPFLSVSEAKQGTLNSPAPKRRRTSASSNDSGLDDATSSSTCNEVTDVQQKNSTFKVTMTSKYPPLILTDEEKRLCEREGIKLPSHYPLSREEEKNLKRIRRKIRNKVSAQDSRKRKKEYVDAMEDRVRESDRKIEMLEKQNKTLVGQLKRLQQIIVNGGITNKNIQASTSMMILMLSTALFLIPGMKDNIENKPSVDVSEAVKVPPMPGQSRSLLQFSPNIKEEFVDVAEEAVAVGKKEAIAKFDHDYYSANKDGLTLPKSSVIMPSSGKMSYIEEDAPPQGYGPDVLKLINATNANGDKMILMKVKKETKAEPEMVLERRVNVTRGPGHTGTRTVLLHVPKDIK